MVNVNQTKPTLLVLLNDLYSVIKDSFCDMIGVCKSSGELADLLTRADKNLTSMEIVLMDWSATCVSLTLKLRTLMASAAKATPLWVRRMPRCHTTTE